MAWPVGKRELRVKPRAIPAKRVRIRMTGVFLILL